MTLKFNELQDLVLPKISIDEFSPKTGSNKDVIVLGFYVKDREPAKDLSKFIETAAFDILDVEHSPATDEDGNYMVFVEVKRNDDFFEFAEKLVDDIDNIIEDVKWEYKPYYSDNEFGHGDMGWKNYVITDPKKYVTKEEFNEQKVQEEKQRYNESIGNFFIDSLISSVSLDENNITIDNGRRKYTFEILNFGNEILEDISSEPLLDRMPDDIYFERVLGKGYVVNNFSEQRISITKEGSDKVLMLKKLWVEKQL